MSITTPESRSRRCRPQLPFAFALLAAVLLSSLLAAPPAAAQSFNRSLPLYVLDASNNLLRTVDPLTGDTLTVVNIVDADGNVTILEGVAIAVHPTSGQLFASLTVTGPTFVLATIDPSTDPAQATIIGPVMLGGVTLKIGDLTFDPDGTLYGINSEDSVPPSELVTIDLTTAAAASVVSLDEFGADQRGNAIAFNPEDNLIYHATLDSDTLQPFMQTADPFAVDVAGTKSPVTLQGSFDHPDEMDYFGNNTLLLFDGSRSLFLVKASGQVRFLSDVVVGSAGGVAFASLAPACPPAARLYGAAHIGPDGPSLFYAIDETDGTPTLVGPIGFERVSAMDFLSTGSLIAIGETQDGNNTVTTLEIDPCTGLGSAIGPTGGGLTTVQDISANSSDAVFGTVISGTQLATVNTATGAGATVDIFDPFTAGGGGLAFDPVNTLFLVSECNPAVLSTVNPADATRSNPSALANDVPGEECARVNAMDFDPASGALFGSLVDGGDNFTSPRRNFLVTIDTALANVVTVGPTQEGLDALAFNSIFTDLEITKVADPPRAVAGDEVTFTLTITNLGPVNATNVVVFDDFTLTNDFALDTVTPSQGACTGFLTCELGGIANGASATVEIVVITNVNGDLPNTATVTADQADPDTSNNSSTVTLTPSLADLEITKVADPLRAAAGDQVTFTLTVTNNGPDTATNVVVFDDFTLTDDFALQSATPSQGTCMEFLTCELGDLANGASATIEIVVTLNVTGSLPNTATVASDQNDPDTSNNSSTATIVPSLADLSITKTIVPGNALVGENVTFTLTITNLGPDTATNVLVTDVLSDDFILRSSDPSQGDCAGFIICELGSLANGASATVDVVLTAGVAGLLSNTATVASAQDDPVAANNSATATVSVEEPPAFTVTVAPTGTSVLAGQTAAFTVTVTTTAGTVGAVALSCVNASGPFSISCAFNPASVNPGTGMATSALTVSHGALAVLGPESARPLLAAFGLALSGLIFLGLVAISGGRRRLAGILAMVLVLALLLPLAGCQQEEPSFTATFQVRGTLGDTAVTSGQITLVVLR